jgi:hypothetical protein
MEIGPVAEDSGLQHGIGEARRLRIDSVERLGDDLLVVARPVRAENPTTGKK